MPRLADLRAYASTPQVLFASIPVVACDVFVEALEQTLEITKPTDAYPYGHKCENGYGEKKKNGPKYFPHVVDLSYEKVL